MNAFDTSRFSRQFATNITPVALPPVADSVYEDFTLEPSMVRVRSANSAYLNLSSTDVVSSNEPPIRCTVGTPGDGVLMSKVKRLGLKSIQFNHNTPVINSENCILYMYRSSNLTVYTLTLPIGNWNTPQQLTQALYDANVAAATGVTFTFLFKGAIAPNNYPPERNNTVTLTTSEPIVFLSESPAILRGASTFGWPVIDTPQWNGSNPDLAGVYVPFTWTTMIIGPMPCTYTRYVDFFSPSLTSWTKLRSVTTKAGANSFIYRLFLEFFEDYPNDPGVIVVGPASTPTIHVPINVEQQVHITNPITWTLNTSENINTVQIDIRDEYGKEFKPLESWVVRETIPGDSRTITKKFEPDVYIGGVNWNMAFYAEL